MIKSIKFFAREVFVEIARNDGNAFALGLLFGSGYGYGFGTLSHKKLWILQGKFLSKTPGTTGRHSREESDAIFSCFGISFVAESTLIFGGSHCYKLVGYPLQSHRPFVDL
jgi:hypothetical protein